MDVYISITMHVTRHVTKSLSPMLFAGQDLQTMTFKTNPSSQSILPCSGPEESVKDEDTNCDLVLNHQIDTPLKPCIPHSHLHLLLLPAPPHLLSLNVCVPQRPVLELPPRWLPPSGDLIEAHGFKSHVYAADS